MWCRELVTQHRGVSAVLEIAHAPSRKRAARDSRPRARSAPCTHLITQPGYRISTAAHGRQFVPSRYSTLPLESRNGDVMSKSFAVAIVMTTAVLAVAARSAAQTSPEPFQRPTELVPVCAPTPASSLAATTTGPTLTVYNPVSAVTPSLTYYNPIAYPPAPMTFYTPLGQIDPPIRTSRPPMLTPLLETLPDPLDTPTPSVETPTPPVETVPSQTPMPATQTIRSPGPCPPGTQVERLPR